MGRYLAQRAEALERELQNLVATDSYSARDDAIAQVAEHHRQRLEALGLQVDVQRDARGTPHVLARKAGTTDRVAMIIHMDTVYPELTPWTVHADDPAIAYGSGVADAKGGNVVVLATLEALAHAGWLAPLSLTVLFNGDEETGSTRSGSLVEEVAREARWVLVYEAGSPVAEDADASTLVVRRIGTARFRLTCHGVAAHSGLQHTEGISAIEELAVLIPELHARTDLKRELTVNVGIVSGGTAVNTIADKAEALVDVRFRNGADVDVLERWLRERAEQPRVAKPWNDLRCEISVEQISRRPPMEPTDESLALARHFISVGNELGQRLVEQSRNGGSDASLAMAAGTPAVDGLGTVGAQFHRADEWYRRNSLVRRASLSAVGIGRLVGLSDG